MAASSRRRSRFHEVVHVTPKTSDALEAAPQKKRQGSRSCGFWQEVANAVTMPFLLICMCIPTLATATFPGGELDFDLHQEHIKHVTEIERNNAEVIVLTREFMI